MTYEAVQIMSRRGANFELDRSRRDALATYAQLAANDAGKPAQTWVRETWGFKVYEAKHLLAGNASEVMWQHERQRVAHERARYAAEEARISALEDHARRRRGPGPGPLQAGRSAVEPRVAASRVGGRTPG